MARDTIFYSYNRNINGLAAILDEEDASRGQGVSFYMFGLSSHELYPLIKASDANADNVSSEIA
ncbi:unnamed protein product [Lupinus luteus]|uniref:Uncharacterized protein n=1 Tax=Lupinus luteus TaxID=3873 RepID=A0AAV1XDZ3_LUPLU